jgi:hypothetical protein
MVIKDRSLNREETTIVEFNDGQRFKVPKQMSVGELAGHLLNGEVDAKLEEALRIIYTIREGEMLSRTYKITINGKETGVFTPLANFKPPLKIRVEKR